MFGVLQRRAKRGCGWGLEANWQFRVRRDVRRHWDGKWEVKPDPNKNWEKGYESNPKKNQECKNHSESHPRNAVKISSTSHPKERRKTNTAALNFYSRGRRLPQKNPQPQIR